MGFQCFSQVREGTQVHIGADTSPTAGPPGKCTGGCRHPSISYVLRAESASLPAPSQEASRAPKRRQPALTAQCHPRPVCAHDEGTTGAVWTLEPDS